MGWFIAQSLVFILVAFAIGLLVGWLIWGRRSDRNKTVVEESAGVAKPAADTADDTAVDDAAVVAAAAVPAPRADSESSVSSEAEADTEVTAIPVPRADSEDADVSESDVETEPVAAAAEPELEPEPELEVETEPEADVEAEPEAEVEAEPEASVGETDQEPTVEAAEAVAGAAVIAEAESVTREAAKQEPQDLKRIEGIGPKIDAALKAQGYPTYASVAAATEDELRAAIKAEGVRFAPSASSWARQAQFLAEGDEDGLKEFQDYLVGGQDRSVKFNEKVDFADVDEITDAGEKAEAIAEDAAEVAAAEAAEGDATEAKA